MARYFVRFPQSDMRTSARSMLDTDRVRYAGFYPRNDGAMLIADLSDQQRSAAESNGAKVYEDVQFEPVGVNPLEYRKSEWAYWEAGRRASTQPVDLMRLARSSLIPTVEPWQTKSLRDVLDHIRAPQAWAVSRGAGVTIGIVDTGVAATMAEFPVSKRSSSSKSFAYASPWEDPQGHGSMCACIATGTRSDGGKYDGVAPDAELMSLRTTLQSTDIYKLYDWVITEKRTGNLAGPIVLSNSYGLYTCTAMPGLPQDHPYREIVLAAVAEGITVVFAAGNNHHDVLCNHPAGQCKPNTIWAVNSMDEVLSVGTVNWDNSMYVGKHANSSRGPGQWASAHPKPDCVAPTYGEVIWGAGYTTMEWWGTSGACPQVAGLAALLLSADPTLKPHEVADFIRKTCTDLGLPKTCGGAGLIACDGAVALASTKPNKVKPSIAPKTAAAKKKTKKAKRKTVAKTSVAATRVDRATGRKEKVARSKSS